MQKRRVVCTKKVEPFALDLDALTESERQNAFARSVTVSSVSSELFPISAFSKNFEEKYDGTPDDLNAIEEVLRSTTWVAIHATDAIEQILRSGYMLSTKRLPQAARSGLTSGANNTVLDHADYIFFRIQAMAAEMDVTRYGCSSIAFKLDDFQKISWLSLLDQHSPFSRESTRALKHQGKTIRSVVFEEKVTSPKKWRISSQTNMSTIEREITVESQVLVGTDTHSLSFKLVNAIMSELLFLYQGGGVNFCKLKNEEANVILKQKESSQREIDMGIFATELMKHFFRPELKACAFIDLKTTHPIVVHNPIGFPRYTSKGVLNPDLQVFYSTMIDMEKETRINMRKNDFNEQSMSKLHDIFFMTNLSGQKCSEPIVKLEKGTQLLSEYYQDNSNIKNTVIERLVAIARVIERLNLLANSVESVLQKKKIDQLNLSKNTEKKWTNTCKIPAEIKRLLNSLIEVQQKLMEPGLYFADPQASPGAHFETAIRAQYWRGVRRALGIRQEKFVTPTKVRDCVSPSQERCDLVLEAFMGQGFFSKVEKTEKRLMGAPEPLNFN